jgi:hypothetical protein
MFDTPVTPENVVASRDASPPVAVKLIVSMPEVCTPAPNPTGVAATVTILRVSEPAPPVSESPDVSVVPEAVNMSSPEPVVLVSTPVVNVKDVAGIAVETAA